MHPISYYGAAYTLSFLAIGVYCGGGRDRGGRFAAHKLCAYFMVILSLLTPFAVPLKHQKYRALTAIGSLFYAHRSKEVFMIPSKFRKYSWFMVFAHVGLSFFDIDRILPHNPSAARRDNRVQRILLSLLLDALFIVAILTGDRFLSSLDITGSWVLHYFFAACQAMMSLNFFGDVLRACWRVFGYDTPRLMCNPERSRSLREFWGQRWNSVIQNLLKSYVYKPLRRRGYRAAAAASMTFLASGAIHTYPIFVATLSPEKAAFMMLYFVIQLILVFFETSICGEKAHEEAQAIHRVWTLAAVLLPSPLFLLPCNFSG